MLSFWNTCQYCSKKFIVSQSSAPDKSLCSYTCYVQGKARTTPVDRSVPTVRRSRKQEKRTAKDGRGRQVIASGAIPGIRGDVRLKDWLVECKTTQSQSYRFTLKDWQNHCVDAAMVGRKPAFEIDISGEEFFVIPRREFLKFVKRDV
jgi:hypothetical protein